MWGRKCRSFFVIESSREETGSAKDEAAADAEAEDDDYKDEDEDEEYLDEEEEEEEEDPEAGRCKQRKKNLLRFLFSFFLLWPCNRAAQEDDKKKDGLGKP